MRKFVTLFACLLMAACAGTPFKWSDARKVQAGMTKKEVTAIMGQPFQVTTQGPGKTRYVWSYGNALGQAKALRIDFDGDRAVETPEIPDEFQD